MAPYLPGEMRQIARSPAFQWSALIVLFFLISESTWFVTQVVVRTEQILDILHFREQTTYFLARSFSLLFFN
jgi:hypothetical protein